ncbi:PKD domain-containing protein [Lyngbya confervoides]|uniref:PKD domain-containing protein n=1 Tax=Lyngbya confervoides BDU141951 TaxID=1574623 RepID=A0ABD4T0X3_9CYAN|nr:PKD domain-containing protein [Lyngbya confervoides]MCM1982222.1 PKD domain-containing protein [Lyngbya confervoides BDU141951]
MASNQKQPGLEEKLQAVDRGIDCLDQARSQGLERLQTLQVINNTLLEREQQRLSRKYGATHPRTQKVNQRLVYNQGVRQELEREIERSQIQVPKTDDQTWLVHGRLLTAELKGISGLTLSLFDAENRWVRQLGFTCTDSRGYFAISYSPDPNSPDPNPIPADQPLTLTVTDGDRQILHQEQTPLFVRLGLIDSREIILDPNAEPKTPPEPDDETPVPDVFPKAVQVTSIQAPAQLKVNEVGNFSAEINPDSTPPVTTQWQFGDGATAMGLLAQHSYAEAGTYRAVFTASNQCGRDSKSADVQVRADSQPPMIETVTVQPESPTVGSPVKFEATVQGSPPLSFQWKFGDDQMAQGAGVTHTYDRPGLFTLALTVTNPVGTATAEREIRVTSSERGFWVVRGRVTNLANREFATVTVGLRNRAGEDAFNLGTVPLDREGDFTLRYAVAEFPSLFEARPMLFLIVQDPTGRVLVRSNEAVQPESGKRDRMDIALP